MTNTDPIRTALIQQRAFIEHWLEDLAAGLKPEETTLRDVRIRINTALEDGEQKETRI